MPLCTHRKGINFAILDYSGSDSFLREVKSLEDKHGKIST